MTIRSRSSSLVILLLMALGSGTVNAAIEAFVDNARVSAGDTIRLTLHTEDTGISEQPDTRPLQTDFRIVGGPNSQSSTTIINGKISSSQEISYDLRPLREGTLTIPALKWGSEYTRPILITVAPLSARQQQQMSELIFFETSIDSDSVYVQQQLIYSVKLFYASALKGEFPAPPQLDNAIINVLENENRYSTVKDGRRYYVMERIYAIYPQESGELILPAEVFDGETEGRSLLSRGKRVAARSAGHRIEVKPKPTSFPGPHWLPVKDLVFTARWSTTPPVFTVGEPVNLTLQISAEAAVASLLPPVELDTIERARVYVDPPKTDEQLSRTGTTAIRTETLGIVPTAAGLLEIPELKLYWWSTDSNSIEVASIPAQTFTIEPGNQPRTMLVAPPSGTGDTLTTEPVIREVIPLYVWTLTGGLALAWLFTFLILIRTRRQLNALLLPIEDSEPAGPDEKELFDRLKTACRNNDPAAIRAHLVAWVSQVLGDETIRCVEDVRRIDPAIDAVFQTMDASVYSAGKAVTWQGDALLPILDRFKAERKSRGEPKKILHAMYPAA